MARTTLNIDDELLKQAISMTGYRTKTAVVEAGLRELVRKAKRELLRKRLGTVQFNMTPQEFGKMRHGK